MKPYYRINDLAKLYGLHADTLRYYEEQGLLHPKRSESNYRMYGIQDICNLNIIQDLRALDVSISDIRRYMQTRTVESTLALMADEMELIDKRIHDLQELRTSMKVRVDSIRHAQALPVGECRLVEMAARPSFYLSEGVTMEDDVDYLLKKLEQEHENRIHIIGDHQMGATFDKAYFDKGIYNRFSDVFFIDESVREGDYLIPAGTYACIVYAGQYSGLHAALQKLLAFIAEKQMEIAHDPIELYHVDEHYTRNKNEYLTEVQILVR